MNYDSDIEEEEAGNEEKNKIVIQKVEVSAGNSPRKNPDPTKTT